MYPSMHWERGVSAHGGGVFPERRYLPREGGVCPGRGCLTMEEGVCPGGVCPGGGKPCEQNDGQV